MRRALRSAGWRLVSLDVVGSTMDVARAAGERGIGGRLAIFAELQSRGRGRDGRSWSAPRGQAILCATLWREPSLSAELPRICAVAAIDALAGFGIAARLKWPNDVLIDGAKVGGILVEGFFTAERLDFAVAGVGLNVHQERAELPTADYPTTSLRLASGRALDRATLAAALLDRLADPPADWRERWRGALIDPDDALISSMTDAAALRRPDQRYARGS